MLIEARAEEQGEGAPQSGFAGYTSAVVIELWFAFKTETRAWKEAEWPWKKHTACLACFGAMN